MTGTMSAKEIRGWLGVYVLVMTAVLGAYLLLAGGSRLLPYEDGEVTSAFQIVIPFLLTQIVVVYKFYTTEHTKNRSIPGMPPFLVKAPLLLVTAILVVTLTIIGAGGHEAEWTPTADQFKGLVTFAVALLNASSVFVFARYFESAGSAKAAPAAEPE